jgi:3-oxoadipate enol-lactonase
VRDADFRGDIEEVRVPTLVIAGTHDPVTPPADSKWLAENIRHSTYVELAAAHLSNVEAASGFTAALLAFLKP